MMAPWWVPRGPRSFGCRSWTSWRAGGAHRDGPGAGVAVGVAGVGQDVAEAGAVAGHRGQHGDQGAGRIVAAGAGGHPPGQLGDGRAVLVAHHGGGGGVVAEEQLAVLAGAAAGAVAPGGFGVGAVAGAAGRRPGEGFGVGPVDGQRGAGVLEPVRDGCLEQVVAEALQLGGGQPVGVVFGQGAGDQAEGPLGLPVGQLVRAVFPVRDHAEAPLVVLGQRDQGLVDAGQVGGPVVGQHGQHAEQQGADGQLPGADPDGQEHLDPRRDAGAVGDLFQGRQRDHDGRAAPSSRTASASAAGSRSASRSPRRWEQVIPAACMNVARPMSWAASASQVARSREVSSRGSPVPAGQRADQRGGDVAAAGVGAAADQPGPGGCRRGQQPAVVAGQHRHRPRPGAAADGDDHPAGPAGHVGAVHGAQVSADQPGAGPQADQPARAHPP